MVTAPELDCCMRAVTRCTPGYALTVGASMPGGYNRRHDAPQEEARTDVDPPGPRREGRPAGLRRRGGAEPLLLRQPGVARSRGADRGQEAGDRAHGGQEAGHQEAAAGKVVALLPA